ncbi:MAG TPA: IclR family transcriptional regulator [Candidatus Solibacter sp.]|jgi:DNA-binding IclR family transcriptional regulator|nr:IclR family transcriptional regulator [Candidatus Solibacter sp.]
MIRARQSKSAPVGVVSKVLRVFEALSSAPEGLALKDIAQRTGINKSTAYRFLAHLEFEGYLYRDESGGYVVGPKLVRLGSGVSYQTSLRKISRPVLQELWRVTGETVNLGTLDGQDVFYLDVLQSPHPFRMASPVGSWRPVYCTAMGKALTAFLPPDEKEHVLNSLKFERLTPRTIVQPMRLRKELDNIRQRGYGLDDEEATLGARCISAPVMIDQGKVAAAISVAGPVARMSREKIPLLAKAVIASAKTISARLDASSFVDTDLVVATLH